MNKLIKIIISFLVGYGLFLWLFIMMDRFDLMNPPITFYKYNEGLFFICLTLLVILLATEIFIRLWDK